MTKHDDCMYTLQLAAVLSGYTVIMHALQSLSVKVMQLTS